MQIAKSFANHVGLGQSDFQSKWGVLLDRISYLYL